MLIDPSPTPVAVESMQLEDAPIFFVGAPRSGTTIMFEHFARHPELAWLSNYARALPRVQAVNLVRRLLDNSVVSFRGQKDQFGDAHWFNRYLPRPDESYAFWNAHACEGFDRSFLLDQKATPHEAESLRRALDKVRRYQGRSRVTAKMTGPGRITYLNSVWPNMYAIHVVRDGLDVVRSLLNVHFWKEEGGYHSPWWKGGIDNLELDRWREAGSEPGALAALQWRRIIETTRTEAAALLGDRYIEVKYETFLGDAAGELAKLYERVGMDGNELKSAPLDRRNQSYEDAWVDAYRHGLIDWMQPVYRDLGYTQ